MFSKEREQARRTRNREVLTDKGAQAETDRPRDRLGPGHTKSSIKHRLKPKNFVTYINKLPFNIKLD